MASPPGDTPANGKEEREGQGRRRDNWSWYYDRVKGRPPRETALKALANWEAEFPDATEKRALDLGAGDGRDTVAFLAHGWHVTAIDIDPGGIERLQTRPDLPKTGTLETRCCPMEDADWAAPVDIVNSSFALPFCAPHRFSALFARITDTLAPGGRLAGQLLGPDDEWAGAGVVIFDRVGLDALLAPYQIEHLEEFNRDGSLPNGMRKHWHIYHIVGRKS